MHQTHNPKHSRKAKAKTTSLIWVKHNDGSWTASANHKDAKLATAAIQQAQQAKFRRDGAVRHLGIIVQRVNFWYRSLPGAARNSYDFEDMVSEVTLHVCTKAHKYSAEKAKESTWVFYVADNCCREILSRYNTRSRHAVEEREFADLTAKDIRKHLSVESFESFLRERMAFNVVERVIEQSSDQLRELLAILLQGDVHRKKDLPRNISGLVEELRMRARQQHASFDDFLLVYRSV